MLVLKLQPTRVAQISPRSIRIVISADQQGVQIQRGHTIAIKTAKRAAHHSSKGRAENKVSLTRAIAFSIVSLGIGAFIGGHTGITQTNLNMVNGYPTGLDESSTLPLDEAREPVHNVSVANMLRARQEIEAVIGEDYIITRLDELTRHTSSPWSSHSPLPEEAPVAIVMPGSTEDVAAIVRICHRRRIPVVAFSAGTSLEGNFANTRRGICVDFSRMNKIITIHKDDLDVVVQPGVRHEELNDILAQQQLFFPPDPGPGAMIGGMIGTGCSGTNAFRYGTMKQWVISLTVVLADGTIIKTRQRPVKSSAGYDMTRLFVGSEGTLGLVTEAVLKVTVLPMNDRVAISAFPTIRSAADCVEKVVQQGIQVAAMEIIDETGMSCINASGATARKWAETPTLFFKFTGTKSSVQEQIALVKQIAELSGSKEFVFAKDQQQAEDLWGARKTMLWGAQKNKRQATDKPWVTDVAVPISRLPEIMELTKKDIAECGLPGGIVGHAGDGNFHSLIFFSEDERNIAENVVHRMVERAIQMEGTVTGEHGVGLVKRDYLVQELGQEAVDTMRKIKHAFDPLCLLNCDKVVRNCNGLPREEKIIA